MAKKRRFQSGTDDLEQLEGVEAQQQRSRKTRRNHAQDPTDLPPGALEPLIERVEKSKKRVRNRFAKIKDVKDAIREFGS